MRAPFNTTCDLINGPAAPRPGVVRETSVCRLVRELAETPTLFPLSRRTHYLTMPLNSALEPGIAGAGQIIVTHYGVSDRVAVPAGSVARFVVLFGEIVQWGRQDPYWRYHLATLPFLPADGVYGFGSGRLGASLPGDGAGNVAGSVAGSASTIVPGTLVAAGVGAVSPPVTGSAAAHLAGLFVAIGAGIVVPPSVSGVGSGQLPGNLVGGGHGTVPVGPPVGSGVGRLAGVFR